VLTSASPVASAHPPNAKLPLGPEANRGSNRRRAGRVDVPPQPHLWERAAPRPLLQMWPPRHTGWRRHSSWSAYHAFVPNPSRGGVTFASSPKSACRVVGSLLDVGIGEDPHHGPLRLSPQPRGRAYSEISVHRHSGEIYTFAYAAPWPLAAVVPAALSFADLWPLRSVNPPAERPHTRRTA